MRERQFAPVNFGSYLFLTLLFESLDNWSRRLRGPGLFCLYNWSLHGRGLSCPYCHRTRGLERFGGLGGLRGVRHDVADPCFLCKNALARIAIRLQSKKPWLPQIIV